MNTYFFQEGVYIGCGAAVAGPKEAKGPLGECFDKTYEDLQASRDSWEHAEVSMQKDVLDILISKSPAAYGQIDLLLGGDLINQLTITNFAAKEKDIPFLGLYNACATMAEGMLLGASLIGGKFIRNAVVVASSHNATSERQYRYPTELGVQKSECSQCTVTAAGAMLLGKHRSLVKVVSGTVGTVVDYGMKDPGDMGAAMAPAALRTIKEHLSNSKTSFDDYDLICTGDLGYHGMEILFQMLEKEGIGVDERLQDGGVWMYKKNQGICCGGSGAGCSASVWSSYLLDAISRKKYRRVLLIGTGALLSTVSVGQGDSIPAIAHGIELVREDN